MWLRVHDDLKTAVSPGIALTFVTLYENDKGLKEREESALVRNGSARLWRWEDPRMAQGKNYGRVEEEHRRVKWWLEGFTERKLGKEST